MHLFVEIARSAIERLLHSTPYELDAAGQPADILAPPFTLLRTTNSPIGPVRVQLIVRSVVLAPVVGNAQASVVLGFDDGSVESLGTGMQAGSLAGEIRVPFGFAFRQTTKNNTTVAELVADFSTTNAEFDPDAASRTSLANTFGAGPSALGIAGISAALTMEFRAMGAVASGFEMKLTPGQPSEDMMTVSSLPMVLWLDQQTLWVSAAYAPGMFAAAILGPFIDHATKHAIGLQLSPEGFQRVIRNPAVRKMARDLVSERLIDGFVNDAYAARGGTGGITDADKAEGKTRLDAFLETPDGKQQIVDNTPPPVGGGVGRKRVKKVPDPFSDFDAEIYHVDLWLGEGHIAGEVKARGDINGFGFDATVKLTATPTVSESGAIEYAEFSIGEPDIDISLPWYLEWALGIAFGAIAGPIVGAIAPFLLASIVSGLAEELMPTDDLAKKPEAPGDAPDLARGMRFRTIEVTPQALTVRGNWTVRLDDPRDFWPNVSISERIDRQPVGEPSSGEAAMTCLGILGVVAPSPTGRLFTYHRQAWSASVVVGIDAQNVPLPLTYAPWWVTFGYRSTAQYHFPVHVTASMLLTPGPLTVGSTVWHPTPPFDGTLEPRTLTVDVADLGDGAWRIDVPPDAANILMLLETQVTDARGQVWKLARHVDVANETIIFGEDFARFQEECAGQRKDLYFGTVPSPLDKIWNPPNIRYLELIQAIQTEEPAVSQTLGAIVEAGGAPALEALLSPSKSLGR
jgi:hypothetical protein